MLRIFFAEKWVAGQKSLRNTGPVQSLSLTVRVVDGRPTEARRLAGVSAALVSFRAAAVGGARLLTTAHL